MNRELKVFTDGMNTDVEDRGLPATQYRYAFACDFGDRDGEDGSVTNEKGTQQVPFALPAGVNTCIGVSENISNGSLVYAIHNSLGSHGWYEYFPKTNTVETILVHEILNFSLDRRIHSINIFDDHLTYTDDLAPKHIIISSAKAFTNGTPPSATVFPYDNLLSTGTEEQKTQFINAGAYAPLSAPLLSYSTSEAFINNLENRLFQVIYRYVYLDDSRGCFSPISKISSPTHDENALNKFGITVNNVLNITLDTGHPNVKKIEVGVREGNNGVFFLVDTINKYDLNNGRVISDYQQYTVEWEGATETAIPSEELLNSYNIPLTAKAQSLSYNNYLFYANYVYGFSNIDLDVETVLTPTVYDDADIYGDRKPLPVYVDFPTNGLGITNNQAIISSDYPITIVMNNQDTAEVITFVFNNFPPPGYTNAQLATAILADLNPYLDSINYNNWAANGTSTIIGPYYFLGGIITKGTARITSAYQDSTIDNKIKTLKLGSLQNFGVVYFDEQGRHGGVQKIKQVRIPFYGDLEVANDLLNFEYSPVSYKIDFRFNNLAPVWAKYYQIVRAESNISYHVVSKATSIVRTHLFNEKPTWKLVGNTIFDHIISLDGIEYEFQEGDRIRFISEDYLGPNDVIPGVIDTRILLFDIASKEIVVDIPDASLIVNPSFGASPVQYEIYRQRIPSENIYREICECYPIRDGRLHSGIVDQTPFTPSITLIDYGDAYINLLNNLLSDTKGVETMCYSKHYPSTYLDNGRYHVYSDTIKQKNFYNHFVYGGRYFEDTLTNRLFEFTANNDSSVSSEYGEIRKMESIGYTMKVIQDKKINSVYLNRQIAVNPGGSDSVVLSDKFIGEIRPYEYEDWGTIHPESVIVDERYMYFWDERNAIFVRDDANGPNNISLIKFMKGSKDLALQYGGQRVFGNYDESRGCVFWSFGNDSDSKTVQFDKNKAVWRGYHPYSSEMFKSIGMLFVSFKLGNIWLHNDKINRGVFYGEQITQKISTVFNENWQNIKTWLRLTIHSNKKWHSPNQGDISCEKNDMYNGQETRIVEGKWEYQEGKFNADIPRDMKTPNIVAPIINGDRLKGEILKVTLENSHTELTKLVSVEAEYNTTEN